MLQQLTGVNDYDSMGGVNLHNHVSEIVFVLTLQRLSHISSSGNKPHVTFRCNGEQALHGHDSIFDLLFWNQKYTRYTLISTKSLLLSTQSITMTFRSLTSQLQACDYPQRAFGLRRLFGQTGLSTGLSLSTLATKGSVK